ncbi:sigma factor [Streptomyces sp. NPDC056835]|uniref:sigma factor n=1 Tax=Streptomyces sp. NPDC056835 TaxID=3345956 RepID=UPI0036A0D434
MTALFGPTDEEAHVTPAPPPHPTADTVTDQFLGHRELMFSVIYNLLGSVAETEGALQEVWLAWSARHREPDAEPVHNARAHLVRIAANRALARRADMSRGRETYIGSRLPELR